MRKLLIPFAGLIILAMSFAACSESEGQPTSALSPEATVEAGEEFGQEPNIRGETTVPTDTIETEPAITEEVPAEKVTQEVITATVQATETVTSSELVPVTGIADPGRISNLLDLQVRVQDGEDIAKVEDLVLSLEELEVDYVVVSTGGFLGLGENLIAVPWDRLDVETGTDISSRDDAEEQSGEVDTQGEYQNDLILLVDNEALENAPEFNPDIMPEIGEPAGDWDTEIQRYWQGISSISSTEEITTTEEMTTKEAITSTEEMTATRSAERPAMTQESQLQGVILASQPLGLAIQNDAGDTVARVEDIIIDVETGVIDYVVLSIYDGAGLGDVLIPVPVSALRLDSEAPAMILVDADQVLEGAPSFKLGEFPPTTEPDWDVEVRSYWEQQIELEVEQ